MLLLLTKSLIEHFKNEIKENTKAVYVPKGKTIGNPSLQILDFDKFSKLAAEGKIPLIIDNTLPPPTFSVH